ncbi:uncharacterized protein EI90DRAFT_3015978 [Cantharellus anzutake]|uniref:uncharacterized protein n=1 Tax=Cantharellus anzutake TaxID=1750568 RepID=UPI0019059398|nr:uncharacterized protein EI90DRAFT_3015978 [Cantharellus anzutake]KAF8332397.1 hypothetical protein EI90DRAFT_3015978 [Cantharellus anzutake]
MSSTSSVIPSPTFSPTSATSSHWSTFNTTILVLFSCGVLLLLALIIAFIIRQYRRRMAALTQLQKDIERHPRPPSYFSVEKLPIPDDASTVSLPEKVYQPGAVHHPCVPAPITYEERIAGLTCSSVERRSRTKIIHDDGIYLFCFTWVLGTNFLNPRRPTGIYVQPNALTHILSL